MSMSIHVYPYIILVECYNMFADEEDTGNSQGEKSYAVERKENEVSNENEWERQDS